MRWLAKFFGCELLGGALGCMAAANWPNQNDSVAGLALGGGGVLLGGVVGVMWAERSER